MTRVLVAPVVCLYRMAQCVTFGVLGMTLLLKGLEGLF